MHVCWVAAVSLLLVLAPRSAAAQDTAGSEDDARTEEARSLFAEGLELVGEERYEEAAEKFRHAYRLRPATPIAFNFGNALVECGRLVEGTEMLRVVTRDSSASGDLRERAEYILEQAEQRIGSLVVHVSGASDGVVVEVDGERLSPQQYDVPVSADPGPVEVVALRDGEPVTSGRAEVPEGARAELTLDIPAPATEEVAIVPTEPLTDDVPEDEGGGILSRWWFWTAVGLVVAGGVVAAIVLSTSGGNTEGTLGSGMLQ